MTPDTKAISRRAFITAQQNKTSGQYCISSAVASLMPGREDEVLARLEAMDGVETGARQGQKVVLLLEGATSGAVGSLLAQIAVMDGVISANMVFEHTERAGA